MVDYTVVIQPPSQVSVVVQPITPVTVAISVGQGPAGPPGIQGLPGTADLNYAHDQMTASDVWTIDHNLGKYPSVTVLDSSGAVCEGHVEYISALQLSITFSSAFAGMAYLN